MLSLSSKTGESTGRCRRFADWKPSRARLYDLYKRNMGTWFRLYLKYRLPNQNHFWLISNDPYRRLDPGQIAVKYDPNFPWETVLAAKEEAARRLGVDYDDIGFASSLLLFLQTRPKTEESCTNALPIGLAK